MYIIVFVLISLLTYLFIKYPDRGIGTNPRTDIINVKGYPIIGNILELHKGITYFLYKTLMEYGPNV